MLNYMLEGLQSIFNLKS